MDTGVAAPSILERRTLMDKAQAITLLFLMKNDTRHLKSLAEYIQQFNVIEKDVRSLLEQMDESQ